MSLRTLYRLGGVALTVGAAISGLVIALERHSEPQAPAWLELAHFVAVLFVLLGLAALFARQREQAGALGLIGFLGVFLGLGGEDLGYTPTEFAFAPAALNALPNDTAVKLIESVSAAGSVAAVLFAGLFVVAIVGIIALGIATFRARVLPRWVGVVGLVSLPATIGLGFLGSVVPALPHGPVLIWAGLTAYGIALISSAAELRPAAAHELARGEAVG